VNDPFNLQRFLDAQDAVYEQVLRELRAGRKTSHWMWFVFPQIEGLGFSPMATRYAISGRDEAVAYAEHTVLGPRLRECTSLVNAVEGRSIHQIFGSPDDLKFRSCMTLFRHREADWQVFQDALDKYFGGAGDPLTLARLEDPAGT
jgi:uncharacterized protein (DUF1810 family)